MTRDRGFDSGRIGDLDPDFDKYLVEVLLTQETLQNLSQTEKEWLKYFLSSGHLWTKTQLEDILRVEDGATKREFLKSLLADAKLFFQNSVSNIIESNLSLSEEEKKFLLASLQIDKFKNL